MIHSPDPTNAPRRRRRAWKILAVVLGCGLFLATVVFLRIGQWLVVEDPPEKSAAIVVLSGSMPLRALEAAKLYRNGLAPAVWLTHPREPSKTMAELGVPFEGEDYYNQLILVHEGVPPAAIRVLDSPIVNTADEIQAIASALEQEKNRTVILVTTKAHTRRTRLLWRRLAAGQGRAIVRAASRDPFEPAHWWRSTSDTLDVVREVLGLLNAWAGLPLHPAAR